MLNDNAKKWVEALRSGKYKQCKEQLSNGDGYCCLGVACEVALENGVNVVKADHTVDIGLRGATEYDGHGTCLPPVVQEWLGLQMPEGRYYKFVHGINGDPRREQYRYLTNDNDEGKNFVEIADIIESEPKGLFKE